MDTSRRQYCLTDHKYEELREILIRPNGHVAKSVQPHVRYNAKKCRAVVRDNIEVGQPIEVEDYVILNAKGQIILAQSMCFAAITAVHAVGTRWHY